MKKRCSVALICFLISQAVISQPALSGLEIGIYAGASIYQGDLTPSIFGSYKTVRTAAGVFGNIIISPAFSLRPNFAFGKLEGDDSKYNDREWRQQRNFKFKSSFKEYSALLVWDVFSRNFDELREGFSPYLFGGIGYTSLKGHRNYSNFNQQYFSAEPKVIAGLNRDIAEPNLTGMLVVPVGVGARYSVSPVVSVIAEATYRLSGSDYLDGFSMAADTKQKDRYYTASIGLIFNPGKRSGEGIKCPVFKN